MNGIIGLNVLGDRAFNSAVLISLVERIQPAYTVVLNNPILATQLLPYTTVIYRRKRSGGDDANNDDNAQAHSDAAEFVRLRHEEAPPGAVLYATNEPGKADAARLNTWTLAAIESAHLLGRKLCILNWATGNPEPQDWDIVAPSIELNNRYGGLNGAHGYWMSAPNQSPSYPYHVGRYFDAVRRFGGKWVITEVGANKQKPGSNPPIPDPYAGWMTFRDESVYADDATLIASLHAPLNIGVCYFSYPEWDGHGFDVSQATKTLHPRWIALNQTYKVNEPVITPPTLPASPDRATLGDPVLVTVTSTAANLVNERADVNRSAAIVTTFKTGDVITLRPTPTPELYDTFHWYAIESPVVGWSANVFKWAASAPLEDWIVNLDVPYVSQTDAQAQRSQNDCAVASLLMLERYWFTQHGLRAPIYPTVDDLERYTPLAQTNPPHGLNFTDIAALARATGFETQYVRPMTPDAITASLQAGKPCMVLVDYSAFNPTKGEEFAHFAIVKGVSENYFNCADPYGVDNYRISRTQLDAAMKLVVGNVLSYQGVTLAV